MKKSKIITIVLSVVLALVAIAGGALMAINRLQSQKTGNKANVAWYDETLDEFTISTVDELYDLVALSDFYDFEGQTILLDADLVLNEGDAAEWAETAPGNRWTPIRGFAGTFDGQGHTISGMYGRGIDVSMGLFTDTTSKSKVKDLKIVNSYFEADGDYPVGSISANGSGTFEKIYSNAIVVTNGERSGGIIGEVNPVQENSVMTQQTRISNCWFDGELRMETERGMYGGGIAGKLTSGTTMIEHCLNSAPVSCESTYSGGSHVGGICGALRFNNYTGNLTIRDCLNVGEVKTKILTCVGSIIGRSFGQTQMVVENTYATVESGENVWHFLEGKCNGEPTQIEQKYLLGNGGFEWTDLDFNTYWTIVNEGTPILQAFATEIPSVAGLKKAYNLDWYDSTKKEFTLNSLEDLRGFAMLAKRNDFAKRTIKLGADIVMNEGDASTWGKNPPAYKWTPIGWTEADTSFKKFAGTFDGQGHTISGMYVNTDTGAAGLFGNVVDATIKNLKITNSYIESSVEGWAMAGSVAGLGYGVFDTIYSDAIIVSAGEYAGGIFGMMNESAKPEGSKFVSKMTNCWFDGEVRLVGEKATKGGGILGGVMKAQCSVEHCLNSGKISSEIKPGDDDTKVTDDPIVSLGGIVGYIGGKDDALTIKDCLGVGKIVPKGSDRGVGSVLGFQNNGTMIVENAYGSDEAYKTTGAATLSGGNGFFRIPEKDLIGVNGYANTMLDFYLTKNTDGYWVAVKNGTPVLKSFAGSSLNLNGVARRINTDWYNAKKSTYEINTLAELRGFRELLKNIDFNDKTIKLTADIVVNTGEAATWGITAPAEEWIPMGWTEEHPEYKKFSGTFDGQGHTVSGLYVSTDKGAAGFFGNVVDCTIKNLKIKNSYIESKLADGWAMVGSVAGLGYGVLDTIYSDAIIVSHGEYSGGMFGMMNESAKPEDSKFESKIINCWFDGELQLKGEKATKGGGILGGVYSAECTVAHCLNTATVSSEISPGNDDKKTSDDPIVSLGGIVGYINGKKDALTIEDCLGAGKMAPKGSNRGVGSVLGFQNNGTMVVNNAYAVEESWSTTGGAILSGGNGFFRIPEKKLLGADGYANTMLNFYVANTNPSGYWAAVSNATPVLKSFVGNALDLSGVARRINTDWYDKDKDEYEISSLAELLGFAELLKNTNFKGKTVKLTANITLNTGDAKDWATTAPANSWTPMGWNGAHNEYQKFAGTFDGQFHEISGIYVKEAMEGIGLFGNLDNATIKNLKLVNSYFESTLTSGWGMVGSIAGLGYGTFDSIYSDAIVANSANYTGGLVGKLTAAKAGITATFTNCWFAGEVQMKGQNGIKGGGIVGAVEGVNDSDKDTICKIKHCLNTGTISSEAGNNALISLGGLVGHMHYKTDQVSLDDCLNVGTINPKDSTRGAGSIMGFVNNGTFAAERTYGMTESYGSLGAYTITADTKIDKIDCNNLKGLMGYMNTLLDFYIKDENESGYWEAMKDDVPQLRTFAKGEVDDLTGASRAMNTDWYYGHESDTEYVLYTLGDLRGFSEIAKTYNFAGKTVKLGADIEYNKGTDVSAWKNVWTPIGATDSNYKYQKFAGTFDGQGHSVSGIYVTTSDGAVGFFGNVGGATIKNFKLLNSYIESTRSKDGEWGMVGSIAGCGYGTFESIYSNATVKCGARYVGGMVGKATAPSDGKSAIFTNCQFAGNVEADGAGAIDIAGFVGAAERITLKIQHCLTSGTVVNKSTRSGNLRVAGFMGYASGNATVVIEDSLSVGNVSYTRSANDVTTGSIVGWDCSGSNTYQYVYTTEECCKIVGAMNNPSRITRLPKAQLQGTDGYKNSFLNFYRPVTNETGYWVAVEGSTPELKTFATSSMSLDGVERPYDISWYDSSVKTHEIADAEDFRGFIELAKSNNFSGHTVKLTGDIVLNTSDAKTWGTTAPTYEMTPIGKSGENTGYAAFAGTFDGQGHSISGVYMKSDKGMLGLFGETEICTIKNFKLLNSYIESTYAADPGMVGSVAGKASGTVEAVYSDAIVISGCTYSGGIVGMAEGKNGGNKLLTISNCQFAGELHMKGTKGIYAGGILGGTYGNTTIVQHCLNTGKLDNQITSGNGFLAGLVGYSRSGAITVNDCVNVGTVTSSVTSTVGSIFGWDMNGKCTITNTYALATSHSRLGDFTVKSTVKKMTPEELNSAGLEWYNAGAETGYWVKVEGSTPILKTFEPASTTQVAQNTSLFSVLRGFWKALTK